jgi:Ribosomal protein S13/S18
LKRRERVNIERLISISRYREIRRKDRLPLRGQQTHTNARTIKLNFHHQGKSKYPMCGADINALFAQWGLVPSIDSARVNEAIEQFKIIDLHQFASFINELSSAFNNLDMEQLGNSLVIHESSSLEY